MILQERTYEPIDLDLFYQLLPFLPVEQISQFWSSATQQIDIANKSRLIIYFVS